MLANPIREMILMLLIGSTMICTVPSAAYADSSVTDPVFYYYHSDHLGSATIMTNRDGDIVQHYGYNAFGSDRYQHNTAAFGVTNRYTGQKIDEETGLYFYQSRYYDAELGRFTQADTIVPSADTSQALNRYAYVKNNPLKFTDPSGHGWFKKWFGTILSVAFLFVAPWSVWGISQLTTKLMISSIVGNIGGTIANGGTFKSFAIGLGISIAASYIGGQIGGSLGGGTAEGFSKWAGEGLYNAVVAGALTGAVSGAISSAVYGGKTYRNMLGGAQAGAIGGAIGKIIKDLYISVNGAGTSGKLMASLHGYGDRNVVSDSPMSDPRYYEPMLDCMHQRAIESHKKSGAIMAYARKLRGAIGLGMIDAVEGLARVAEVLAHRYPNDKAGFVRHFGRIFSEFDGPFPTNTYYVEEFGGSTGFKAAFNDGTDFQARHFAGFMVAGFYGGMDGTTLGLAVNEFPDFRLWNADWRLGWAAAWLGVRLRPYQLVGRLKTSDVPNYIRENFKD